MNPVIPKTINANNQSENIAGYNNAESAHAIIHVKTKTNIPPTTDAFRICFLIMSLKLKVFRSPYSVFM
jgi:hypothetical protein